MAPVRWGCWHPWTALTQPKSTKNRVHPDLSSKDLEAGITRLKGLGATHLADPEGNEFDVAAG